MLTPQDVRSVQFEKNLRGYRTEDVDRFLDKVEQQLEQDAEQMEALRKQVAEFQGKVAVSHDDLMQTIKDAIKDGLKGMVVGGVAAGAAVAGADAAEAAPAEENAVPDDFGFGSSGSNSDGFGF